ncbi:hypothetical protein [Colwellia sp. MB02u-9]|uniref:hypothetical protein n=1 Tax=Colwellia sp. MB02u-9 TaxID=2759823 RepID=UPI0015F5D2A4|nr:hypothetical protein [Colwellia sp. MB02u-9]MBA6296541.1 hypothetical protein [Colwellia sp. MB02u-9]
MSMTAIAKPYINFAILRILPKSLTYQNYISIARVVVCALYSWLWTWPQTNEHCLS